MEKCVSALERFCEENGLDIPSNLLKSFKRQQRAKDKGNAPAGGLSAKMKEKLEAQLDEQRRQFEQEKDNLNLKCNVLLQENGSLAVELEQIKKEKENLQEGFTEYVKNNENMDNSIMRTNPNDESSITLNRSLLNVLEGQEIRNTGDFENFLFSLQLSPNEQDSVNNFWKKQKKRMEKERRWINKLKKIINELLSNYQKLIERELPDLQEHHNVVLESLKETERKHIIAFNDKILGGLFMLSRSDVLMLLGTVIDKINFEI